MWQSGQSQKGSSVLSFNIKNYISNFKVTFKLNLQFGAHTVSRLSRLQPPVCLEMVFKGRKLFNFFFEVIWKPIMMQLCH